MTDRAAQIQARIDAATPGPWSLTEHGSDMGDYTGMVDAGAMRIANVYDLEANAELIAHAPDDLAYLLGRVRELEAELRKHEMGPTPQRCPNDDCSMISFGMGYKVCPGCGAEPVLASGEA